MILKITLLVEVFPTLKLPSTATAKVEGGQVSICDLVLVLTVHGTVIRLIYRRRRSLGRLQLILRSPIHAVTQEVVTVRLRLIVDLEVDQHHTRPISTTILHSYSPIRSLHPLH